MLCDKLSWLPVSFRENVKNLHIVFRCNTFAVQMSLHQIITSSETQNLSEIQLPVEGILKVSWPGTVWYD